MKTTFTKCLRFFFTWWLSLWAGAATVTAADQVTAVDLVPRLSIEGTVGATAQIQYSTNLSQHNWVPLTNLLVQETNYSFVDVGAPHASGRFYRVIRFSPEGMVLIPSGSFLMGDPDGSDSALPLHTVNVSAFFMDQHEVTKELWNAVKSWNAGNGYGYENPGSGKANAHPIQSVNWRDCVKWCNARSEQAGRMPCYYNEVGLTTVYKIGTGIPYVKWDANGYRLPTEAEWERAARGGADGQRFPWGNTISWSHANYFATPASLGSGYAYDVSPAAGYCPAFDDGVNPFTGPVGHFAANGYGLYDMAGNVWEWCWDFYGSYTSGSQTDPRGPASGSERVYRGGGWGSGASLCRVAARYSNAASGAYNTIGFRCVVPSDQ